MVRMEIFKLDVEEPIAVVEADGASLRVEERVPGFIDRECSAIGLPSRRVLENAAENPEEWTRGLLISLRSPDLNPQIVHDDAPLPAPERGAPITIPEPISA